MASARHAQIVPRLKPFASIKRSELSFSLLALSDSCSFFHVLPGPRRQLAGRGPQFFISPVSQNRLPPMGAFRLGVSGQAGSAGVV